MTPEELGRHVREAFAYLARYISLLAAEPVTRLLARPDVDAVLVSTLDQASRLTRDAVRETWAEHGGPPHQYLTWLIDDADRAYQLAGEVRRAVRRDHADGAAAVRGAVLDIGAHAALRSQLILHVAAVAAQTMKQIEEGTAEQAAGAHVWKQWLCREDPATGTPDDRVCHWCRALHRVVVPLHGNFPLGKAADLTGHGHLTRPPRAYHHVLPGPPRHPRCRCRIVILTNLPAHQVASATGGQEAAASPPLGPAQPGKRPPKYPGLLAASDVRALDEGRYQALVHFLSAAVHELGQVLARLRRVLGA